MLRTVAPRFISMLALVAMLAACGSGDDAMTSSVAAVSSGGTPAADETSSSGSSSSSSSGSGQSSGTGSSSGGSTPSDPVSPGTDVGQPTVPVTQTRDGKIYRQAITVAATGDTAVFQVFEPTHLVAGQSYPLVLQGHGYGGSRETTAPAGSFIARLRDAGYYVISIDERGFGESSGTVRIMDPQYEGQDLIAILDWAEGLAGLRRHSNGSMVVGSYGGSYGGMYQMLLAGADPKHRLRVIAPDITPHDLNFSLNEGNVVKSGWGLALVGGGELPILGLASGDTAALQTAIPQILQRVAQGEPTRQDATVYELLLNGGLTNIFNATDVNYLAYHSASYFCNGQAAGPQSFVLPVSVPDRIPAAVAPTPYPAIDALFSQGMMDTLFNYNNGYANYQCLKQAGGDVRLLSHQSGHILPLSLSSVPGTSALDPFYAAINPPEFQGPSGSTACGGINVADADFAWFQEKLQGVAGAIDQVITTGKDFCMSISDGDAIQLHAIKQGGTSFKINGSTPQLNSLLGVVGSLLGGQVREKLLSVQPLYTATADKTVVAGMPTLNLNVASLVAQLQQSSCPLTPLMLGSCDPIFFIGIGKLASGSQNWQLVDAQLTPVRGFGEHDVSMNGISTRLNTGDQLGLLIYAFHAQYPITWSRDIFVPAATLTGSVQLPILSSADIVRQGI